MKVIFALVVLIVAVSQTYSSPIPNAEAEAKPKAEAEPQLGNTFKRQVSGHPVAPATYQYQYEVSDPEGNNFFGTGEKRDGAITSGSYFVLLPDGRRQRVDYTVNASEGYVATVTYN